MIGAIGPHKGYDILKACAEDAAARDLPLEFVVVGYSSDDAGLFATGKIHVTGRYDEEEAEALVRSQKLYWQVINNVIPLAFVLIFAIFQHYIRKRKYAH